MKMRLVAISAMITTLATISGMRQSCTYDLVDCSFSEFFFSRHLICVLQGKRVYEQQERERLAPGLQGVNVKLEEGA
jgi:hypothetical protein